MSEGIYRKVAFLYYKHGFIPIPSVEGKRPKFEWKEIKSTFDYIKLQQWEREYPTANIWIYLGSNRVVIDPDGEQAEEFVKSLSLPKCPTVISGRSSVHRYFKADKPLKPLKLEFPDGSHLEIRTGDQGMLTPPSVHPETGKAYEWVNGLSLSDVELPEFPIDIYDMIKGIIDPQKPKTITKEDEVYNGPDGILDVGQYLNDHGIEFRTKKDEGKTLYLLKKCLFPEEHNVSDDWEASIVQGIDGKLTYQCFHDHGKTWHDARKIISGDELLVKYIKKAENMNDQDFNKSELPELPEKRQKAFNVAGAIKEHIELGGAGWFNAVSLLNEMNFSKEERHAALQELSSLVKRGVLKRNPSKRGEYRVVDNELEEMDGSEAGEKINMSWPFEIEQYVLILPGNLVTVAGGANAGKTCFLLNVALKNLGRFKEIRYISSEMESPEMNLRLKEFGTSINELRPKGLRFYKKTFNITDHVLADGLTIIDFVEITENFYEIAKVQLEAFNQLNAGVCIMAIQKDPKKDLGRGDSFGLEKPRLYLTINQGFPNNTLKIVKAKIYAQKNINPNGFIIEFKIKDGAKLIPMGGWKSEKLASTSLGSYQEVMA